MNTWETFTSRLLIGGQLVARTALRIGAGGSDAAQPSASDLPVLIGPDDQPFIPGASLRGVLRSHVERIVRGVERRPAGNYAGRGACMTVVDAELCVTKDTMDGWRQEQRGMDPLDPRDRWLAEQVWDHSCRVCRVFGSPWLASRVRIADLHPPEAARIAIERRDGVAIHREKETVQHKYDFETVPLGNSFALRITAENLSAAERGLLWLGLRELDDGAILLGGFKGRGLGQVRIENLTLQGVDMTDSAARREYILGGKMSDLSAQADTWLAALWAELENA